MGRIFARRRALELATSLERCLADPLPGCRQWLVRRGRARNALRRWLRDLTGVRAPDLPDAELVLYARQVAVE